MKLYARNARTTDPEGTALALALIDWRLSMDNRGYFRPESWDYTLCAMRHATIAGHVADYAELSADLLRWAES